jgi:hypothetical protein
VESGVDGGRTTATASPLLRSLSVEGDPELLVLAQRLFPGLADPSGRDTVTRGRRSS